MAHVVSLAARQHAGPSDAALVTAARAGEAWASEALFKRHAQLANGLAFRLLGRDQEVADVVQDAYVIVLRRLDSLNDPQAFASFLASVVVRRVRYVLRRRRFARRLGLLPALKPIDTAMFISKTAPPDAIVELQAIYRILDDLPTDERLALVLRRVEGLPLEEVARLSECSLATAKRRIKAAEDRLESMAGEMDVRGKPPLERKAR
jgi:RNA polymerase sigma-70 factor, ECF subfamily